MCKQQPHSRQTTSLSIRHIARRHWQQATCLGNRQTASEARPQNQSIPPKSGFLTNNTECGHLPNRSERSPNILKVDIRVIGFEEAIVINVPIDRLSDGFKCLADLRLQQGQDPGSELAKSAGGHCGVVGLSNFIPTAELPTAVVKNEDQDEDGDYVESMQGLAMADGDDDARRRPKKVKQGNKPFVYSFGARSYNNGCEVGQEIPMRTMAVEYILNNFDSNASDTDAGSATQLAGIRTWWFTWDPDFHVDGFSKVMDRNLTDQQAQQGVQKKGGGPLLRTRR